MSLVQRGTAHRPDADDQPAPPKPVRLPAWQRDEITHRARITGQRPTEILTALVAYALNELPPGWRP
ncbi:hypothetical protein H7X46_11360 [Pseudonocardia sp. C8]|uniref:hypothetical protein n=1 Tax=Pseudonocardia sp. C8 TaxID=2762759 RepID=UPI0016428A4B|nr:hypothetical protein [Pseudonocardia sp. C8]MBC3191658.1 hypothetical protein [Pseudonocardia sp. C8]